jgi:hypothetical protein
MPRRSPRKTDGARGGRPPPRQAQARGWRAICAGSALVATRPRRAGPSASQDAAGGAEHRNKPVAPSAQQRPDRVLGRFSSEHACRDATLRTSLQTAATTVGQAGDRHGAAPAVTGSRATERALVDQSSRALQQTTLGPVQSQTAPHSRPATSPCSTVITWGQLGRRGAGRRPTSANPRADRCPARLGFQSYWVRTRGSRTGWVRFPTAPARGDSARHAPVAWSAAFVQCSERTLGIQTGCGQPVPQSPDRGDIA